MKKYSAFKHFSLGSILLLTVHPSAPVQADELMKYLSCHDQQGEYVLAAENNGIPGTFFYGSSSEDSGLSTPANIARQLGVYQEPVLYQLDIPESADCKLGIVGYNCKIPPGSQLKLGFRIGSSNRTFTIEGGTINLYLRHTSYIYDFPTLKMDLTVNLNGLQTHILVDRAFAMNSGDCESQLKSGQN